MNKLQKRIASAITAGTLLVNAGLPVLATTTIQISGNGAGAQDFVTVAETNTTVVNQSNEANVVNNVDADAYTGDNDASFNVGDTAIVTGDAEANISVSNDLNSNAAYVDCCDAGDTDVLIEGNGAHSDNTVSLIDVNTVALDQANLANVANNVSSDVDSGGNDAGLNTGGTVAIATGKAKANVSVSTAANSNVAMVGGGMGASDNPSVSLKILGNGAMADNWIDAALVKTTVLNQWNEANVVNDVDADAYSGDNDADFNTGGEVLIHTGKASADVSVDNALNFNHAAIDCGCTWDLDAKIAGNGAEMRPHHKWGDKRGKFGFPWWDAPDNVINVGLTSAQVYGQDNLANLENDVYWVNADSGLNSNNLNTGDPGSDPLVATGDASTSVDVSNTGNSNTIGGDPMFDWPWEMADVEVSFNLSALMAFFGLSMS